MLEQRNKREKAHLINLIRKRNNNTPNFALLIGAGASCASGIKTASGMIAEWRRQLYEQARSGEDFETWLKGQDWYQDEEEYSTLFEKVYDQRGQRRVYIEECVKNAKLSWGYIYVANVIAYNYFNVIFTANFDDLLNEACFLYADLRPMVCAHDSVVAGIRVTSARPKIIKLHGDFLYDSMKNTVRETEALEKNMRDKFLQFATEYGLVVIGYGGNDRSIMDNLDMVLGSEDYLPYGLYWCRRKDDRVSRKLERLMRRDNAYWVEIEGFDEFMAELHEGLGLRLPDVVRDPYRATTERLNRFISVGEEITNPIIKDDIKELGEQVEGFASKEDFDRFVPYGFLGDTEYQRDDYKKALTYYEKALIQNPDNPGVMGNMVTSLWWLERFEEALEVSERMVVCAPKDFTGYWLKADSLWYLNRLDDAMPSFKDALKYTDKRSRQQLYVLVSRSNAWLCAGDWQKALSDAEQALKIDANTTVATLNRCIALRNLNRADEAKSVLEVTLTKTEDHYLRACIFAALDDKKAMLEELQVAIKEDSAPRVDAKFDPDFAHYRDDPDFRKLVYEGKE